MHSIVKSFFFICLRFCEIYVWDASFSLWGTRVLPAMYSGRRKEGIGCCIRTVLLLTIWQSLTFVWNWGILVWKLSQIWLGKMLLDYQLKKTSKQQILAFCNWGIFIVWHFHIFELCRMKNHLKISYDAGSMALYNKTLL